MKDFQEIKNELYKQCFLFTEERFDTVYKTIASNKKALDNETKSSAGDKHETGRAMLQLEMEKASQQLVVVDEMKKVLDKIDIQKAAHIGCLGSLIVTDKAMYYLAISTGKITINKSEFYAVSTNSPIGKQLLGKKVGAIISFNQAVILEIY